MGAGGATSQNMDKFYDYEGFVEKFKPRRTTDDCYTPPEVYEAVLGYAVERFGIDPARVVRPFRPGGDYESFDYGGGAVVVDNQPFSILIEIVRFYVERSIPFFLFAPSLTCLNAVRCGAAAIVCGARITYENGAVVNTSFITNMLPGTAAESCPELLRRIDEVKARGNAAAKKLAKYVYPDAVLTAAMLQRYSDRGVEFSVGRDECVTLGRLDQQRKMEKKIFGTGLLLSRGKEAERSAIEAGIGTSEIELKLSDRELAMQAELGSGAGGR